MPIQPPGISGAPLRTSTSRHVSGGGAGGGPSGGGSGPPIPGQPSNTAAGGGGGRSLGPPDVYPQDPNQIEDELNLTHVKQGFSQTHASHVRDVRHTTVCSHLLVMVHTTLLCRRNMGPCEIMWRSRTHCAYHSLPKSSRI